MYISKNTGPLLSNLDTIFFTSNIFIVFYWLCYSFCLLSKAQNQLVGITEVPCSEVPQSLAIGLVRQWHFQNLSSNLSAQLPMQAKAPIPQLHLAERNQLLLIFSFSKIHSPMLSLQIFATKTSRQSTAYYLTFSHICFP